ncbi:hypothetical protein JHK85_044236 [Glycine max]|nr:hypothetical protein JHK85_044236 [Glycine max]
MRKHVAIVGGSSIVGERKWKDRIVQVLGVGVSLSMRMCKTLEHSVMESISIKRVYGLAMILGSVLSLAGAITFALVKGPHLGFMKWYQENHNHTSHPLTIVHSKGDTIRGSLLML